MGEGYKALTFIAAIFIFAILIYNYRNDNQTITSLKNVSIEVRTSNKAIYINGNKIKTANQAFESNACYFIPLPEIIEQLGGSVQLEEGQNNSTYVVDYNGMLTKIFPGNEYVFINGTKKVLEAPPQIKEGVVYVTPRFFSEVFGYSFEKRDTSYVMSKEFVAFEDPGVENYIRQITSKSSGNFTLEELQNITKIDLNWSGVVRLGGLQHLPNLTSLSLVGNKIIDIEPLRQLKNLKELNLSKNSIEDVKGLTDCLNLEYLNLSQNFISDMSPVLKLEYLKKLDISGNRLTSITKQLPLKLEDLDVSGNNIVFFPPKGESESKLSTLNLTNNPLQKADGLLTYDNLKKVNIWGLSKPKDVVAESETISSKIDKLIVKISYSGKMQMDVFTAIYDYVLYNFEYKSVNRGDVHYREYSNPIGVLNRGYGDGSGIAQLMQMMYSRAGVESYSVIGTLNYEGENQFHAWNVVSLDGKYYYSDLALGAILGIDNYGHAFINVSDKQFVATHPNITTNRRFPTNTDNAGFKKSYIKGWASSNATVLDYFGQYVTKVGTKLESSRLMPEKSAFLVADENWVYFRNETDGGKLYKIDINGQNKTKINDDQPYYILSDSKYIYYINSGVENNEKGKICAVVKKTGERSVLSKNVDASWIAFKNDEIFHKSIAPGGDQYKIYKMASDGGSQDVFVEDKIGNNRSVDFSVTETALDRSIVLYKDQLFYTNASDNNRIYAIRTNGKGKKRLTDVDGEILEISNNFVYFKNKTGYLRINTAGDELTEFKK